MTMKPMMPEILSPCTFSETPSGYSPTEVDAYIAELTAAYMLLSQENIRLSAALEKATEQSETIIEEAYLKADAILASVQNGCDSILRNFRDKVEAQKKAMESTAFFAYFCKNIQHPSAPIPFSGAVKMPRSINASDTKSNAGTEAIIL